MYIVSKISREMKRIIILLFALSLIDVVVANSNFKEGYVITIKGDTIYGWIEHQNDISLSNKCVFKRTLDGEELIYEPFDIISYRFTNGQYFISKKIIRDEIEESYFLEYLVKGEINLYSLKDNLGISYFFEKPGEKLIEVRSKLETKYAGGYQTTEVSKNYIGILSYVFSDEPQIQEKTSNVVLNRKSLIGISKDYHDAVCTSGQECIIYKKELSKSILTVSGIIGYGTYKFESKPTVILNPAIAKNVYYFNEFDINKGLIGGLSLEITFPYSNGRMSFCYEAVVNMYQVSSSWQMDRSDTIIGGDYEIKATDLSHNFILRYNLLRGTVKPAIYGGGSIAHHLQVQKSGLSENYYFGEIYPEHAYFGFLVGAGVSVEVFENKDYTFKILYKKGFDNFGYFKTDQFTFSLTIPFFNIKI